MLHDIAELNGLVPNGTDGEIGTIDDVYFSDDTWTIRYLVIDAGSWLASRKVLVTPRAVRAIDHARGALQLDLSRSQVEKSPDFDSEKPVSRQFESDYHSYYEYPFYWAGPYLWGGSGYPAPPGSPVGAPPDDAGDEVRSRSRRSALMPSKPSTAASAMSRLFFSTTPPGPSRPW